MSHENVEIVQAIYDEWLGGGMALDRLDPGISIIESKSVPGAPSAHGIEAVRGYMESFASYWAEIRFEPQEYIEAGDQVVVIARLVGRGRKSGVQVTRTWAYVWTIRAKRALRIEAYADRAEALEAVGVASASEA
jgi:ketosteroid isomerase-like protein